MSELASSLSWAVTTAARRHGVVIDSVRLNAAITQAMVKNGVAAMDINSLCAALSLPKSQHLAKPDRAQLPMLGMVRERGWGVIVDQRPDGRWIFISEEGHALVSDSELEQGAYKLDFSALGNKPDQHGFERVFKEALAEYRPILLEVVIASVVMSVIALGASIFSMQVYDRVIPTHGVATLIVLAIGVSLAIIFELGMKFARSHIMDNVVSGLDAKLSQALFERLLSVRVDQLPGSVGSLAGQLRGYEQIRSFYTSQTLFTLVDLPLGLLFVLVIAFIASPWMALVPTVFGLAAIGIGYLSNRKVVRLADKSAAASNLKTGLLVETVEGVETIKSGSGGWKFLSRWIDVSAESIRSDMAMRAIGDHAGYIAAMLQQLSYSTTVIVGSFLVINGQITMGALIACSILGGRILAPVAMIPGLMVQRAHTKATLAGLEKIYALQTDQGNERQLTPDTLRGEFRVEEVKFTYAGSLLNAMSIDQLSIKAGERVAILGPIGAGKSTILRLLSGLYRPQQGRILIDGLITFTLRDEGGLVSPAIRATLNVGSDSLLLDLDPTMPGAQLTSSQNVTDAARIAAGVAFDASVAAPTSTLVTAVKVVLGGAGLDVLNDRLILDTALALNVDLPVSTGKTVGGVTGLSYGYDSASRTLTLSKTGSALWSGSELQSVVQAIKLGGSSSHDGLRTASFSLVSSNGETGNASAAGILFDTHAPTLDADVTLVDVQTNARKLLTAAKAVAGEGLFAHDIAVWPTNDISSIGIRLDGPQLDLQKDKLVLDVPLSLNANLATVSGKSIGGVNGLSYGYDASTHVLTISKSSGAAMSGLDARAIVKAIQYQNATPSAGDRSATITLTDVAGNSSNTGATWSVDMTAPASLTGTLVINKQISYKMLSIPDIMGSANTHNLHTGESADLTSLLPAGMTPTSFLSSLKGLYTEWGGVTITSNPNTTMNKYTTVFSFPAGFGMDTPFSLVHQGGGAVKGENFKFSSPDGTKLLLNAVDGFYILNTDVYAFKAGNMVQSYDIGNVRLLYQVTTDNPNSLPTINVSFDGTKASAGDVISLYEGDKLLGSRILGTTDVGSTSATVDVTVASSLAAGNHVITPKFSDPAGNVVVGNDIRLAITGDAVAPVLSNLRVNGETPDTQPINGWATKYAMIAETPTSPVTLFGLDQNLTFSGTVGGAGADDSYLISVSMGGKVILFNEVKAGDFSLTTPANILAPGMYHDLTITATNISNGVNNGQTTIVQNQTLGWYWVPQKLDSLTGGAGDDQIQLAVTTGGINTVVQTGQGKDTLTLGGFGTTDSTRLVATVSDFTLGQDKVKVFGQTITKDNLNTFVTASAYNTSSTKLVVDLDGAGAGTTSYTLYLQNVAYNPGNTHTIFGV